MFEFIAGFVLGAIVAVLVYRRHQVKIEAKVKELETKVKGTK